MTEVQIRYIERIRKALQRKQIESEHSKLVYRGLAYNSKVTT